jgi:hypothetical protein
MSIREDEIPAVLETLKETLLRKLGGEVDLIFQYGSRLKGSAHKFSDVDLSFVPVHETTWENVTVLVGETLVDLYPMHWPHLERMAKFDDRSSMVLLENRILYQRNEAAAERFRALSAQLFTSLQPEARPDMIRKAQKTFQETAYPYYLLRLQAAAGNRLGCCQQAQSILQTVLHTLAVCNQACIDTRKMAQVLALPKLPVDLAATVERISASFDPDELLSACETLLHSTRELLLAEQSRVLRQGAIYPDVFHSAYPELQNDLHHVMLACERKDLFSLKTSLLSLYQELSLAIARVVSGVEYSGFNGLSEYEQDLVALGFPPLLPHLLSEDFEQLHQQCKLFGKRLKDFLVENRVELHTYATVNDLRTALQANA